MSDAYKIGIQIALATNFSPLYALMGHLGKVQGKIDKMHTSFAKLGVVAAVAAAGIVVGFEKIFTAAEKVATAQAKLRILGPNIDVNGFTDLAYKIQKSVPGSKVPEILDSARELYSIAGPKETPLLLERMTKFSTAMENFTKSKGVEYQALRAADISGLMVDKDKNFSEDKLNYFLDNVWRGSAATGGKVSMAEILNFSKQAASLMSSMSDEGLLSAFELMQGMGGYRAGTAYQALGRQFLGGKMTGDTAEQLVKLGMIDPGGFHKDHGKVIIDSGAMKGQQELLSDPLKFTELFLEQAKKNGITDGLKLRELIFKAIGTGPAQRALAEMIANVGQMKAERGRMEGVMSLDQAMDSLNKNSPEQSMKSFNAAWDNLLGALGTPLVAPAVRAMNTIAESIRSFTSYIHESPAGLKIALEAVGALFAGLAVVALAALAAALAPLVGAGGLIAGAIATLGVLAAFDWHGLQNTLSKVKEVLEGWARGIISLIESVFGKKPGTDVPGAATPAFPGVQPNGALPHLPGLHTLGKQSYWMAPPSTGGNKTAGNVYLDGRKVGEHNLRHLARMTSQPTQGSAHMDASYAYAALDHKFA